MWWLTLNLYSRFDKLKLKQLFGCGNISKISFDIGDELLEDLKKQALVNESSYVDLIVEYVQLGLKMQNGGNIMLNVNLNEKVSEKVNILARLGKKTPEEVVNDTLWENIQDIVDIPDDYDYDAVWDMLDHDKPEGDTILEDLVRLGQEGWD